LPLSIIVVGLCWLTLEFGTWAFGKDAGFYSGLILSTCLGLFLFTRILIPDAILTLTITLAMWSFLRLLDQAEQRPHLWSSLLGVSLGLGLLLKGLIAIVFPIGTAFAYLVLTHKMFSQQTWGQLRPFSALLVMGLIAAPWHILATLRNPPYLDYTLHSAPGEYRGFFWFYFINEHVLRFLNLRYPQDYNRVPRLWFWLFHFVWLFPWSFYMTTALRLDYRPTDRAGRTRLLALCWIGVVLIFFSLSTTQEYYSMPAYSAFALLIGSAVCIQSAWVRL